MGFALFFNILAVIISAIGTIVMIIFTAVINRVVEYSKNNNCQTSVNGMCKCDDVNCKYKYKNVKNICLAI